MDATHAKVGGSLVPPTSTTQVRHPQADKPTVPGVTRCMDCGGPAVIPNRTMRRQLARAGHVNVPSVFEHRYFCRLSLRGGGISNVAAMRLVTKP